MLYPRFLRGCAVLCCIGLGAKLLRSMEQPHPAGAAVRKAARVDPNVAVNAVLATQLDEQGAPREQWMEQLR